MTVFDGRLSASVVLTVKLLRDQRPLPACALWCRKNCMRPAHDEFAVRSTSRKHLTKFSTLLCSQSPAPHPSATKGVVNGNESRTRSVEGRPLYWNAGTSDLQSPI